MSSNILLISTNQCVSPDPVFPLGLACLNAALRQAGHRTVWYDYLAKSHPLEEVLISSRPDYIAISLRNIDDVLIRKRETYFQSLADIRDLIRLHTDSPIIFEKLQSFARRSPNWIVGDPVPGYRKLIQRLRQRGAEGPLWSYLAQIQRLWPRGINVEPAT